MSVILKSCYSSSPCVNQCPRNIGKNKYSITKSSTKIYIRQINKIMKIFSNHLSDMQLFLPVSPGQQSLYEPQCSHVLASSSQPEKQINEHKLYKRKSKAHNNDKNPKTLSSWIVFSKFDCSERDCCSFWLITAYASTILSCSAAEATMVHSIKQNIIIDKNKVEIQKTHQASPLMGNDYWHRVIIIDWSEISVIFLFIKMIEITELF